MPPTKVTNGPASPGRSPADQTWSHYSKVIDRFRKLCHGDAELFKQAINRITAKRVVQGWEENDRPSGVELVDALSKAMAAYVLDAEDDKQIDALYRAKLAFRDRVCAALGKLPDEKWDVFFERQSAKAKVPNTVRQMELVA